MSLAVALQMDPMESVDINADSSFMMALEAQERGHALFHYLPDQLSLLQNRLFAPVRPMKVQKVAGNHVSFGQAQMMDLATLDVILMRQDPPFDMGYITATHMLEHVMDQVLIVNDPIEVRNAPEKLLITRFPDLMPPTLITRDKDQLEAFRAKHDEIIVKPLYGNGGAGVFHLKSGDNNLDSLFELFTQSWREPFIVQKYLPEIRQGDKRIILIDGEPVGAVNRIPASDSARANFHSGGAAQKTEITSQERSLCHAIAPTLRKHGLLFAGIDVIGDYITEINVTSPTGIQEINRLDKAKLEADFWDLVEAKRAQHPAIK